MRKMLLMLTVLFCLSSVSFGVYKDITLDTNYGDWAGVPVITDSAYDSDSSKGHLLDFLEFSIANDADNLYLYVKINDTVNGNPNTEYMQYGGTTNVDYIDAHIDIDNNSSTGTLVGPAASQIGAEYSVASARRQGTASGTSYASSLYSGIHTGDGGGGTSLGFADNSGIALYSVMEGVYEFEERMPLDLSTYGGPTLSVGDTINIVFRSSRSNDFFKDWSDSAIEYTIAVPEPATIGLFALGVGVFVRRRK